MYGVITTLNAGAETGLRPQHSDALQRQRATERSRTAGLMSGSGQGGDTGQYVPSRYMMLISRVDRMMRQGPADDPEVDQLTNLLGERIAGLTARGRRALRDLPEMQALGVDDVHRLPEVLAGHIHAGTEREAVMSLLRSREFAAIIRDESRTTTYGPRGFLRAS